MTEPLAFGSVSASARTVILYGNCQAPALARWLALLDDLNDDYRFVVANRAPDLSSLDPAELAGDVTARAVLLLEQYESPDVPRPGRAALRERLPAGCPVITFPSFLMNCMWPFECPDPRNPPEPRFPYNRYQGDFIALKVAQTGVRGATAVADYLELSTRRMPDLQVRLDRDLRRMRDYDTHCDVQLADFVEARFRSEHLFGTAGHISAHAITELARRVMAVARPVLGGAAARLEACLAGQAAHHLQAPIHPVVAERLGLTFWRPDQVYAWYDQAWTFHEYMERLIANDTSW